MAASYAFLIKKTQNCHKKKKKNKKKTKQNNNPLEAFEAQIDLLQYFLF